MDEKSQNWCFDKKNLPVLHLGGIIAIGKLVGKKVKTGIFFCFDKVLPACLSLRFHLEQVPAWGIFKRPQITWESIFFFDR